MNDKLEQFRVSRVDRNYRMTGRILLSMILSITFGITAYYLIFRVNIVVSERRLLEELEKYAIYFGFLFVLLCLVYIWIIEYQRNKLKNELKIALKTYPNFADRWIELTEQKPFGKIVSIFLAILRILWISAMAIVSYCCIRYQDITEGKLPGFTINGLEDDDEFKFAVSFFVDEASAVVQVSCLIMFVFLNYIFFRNLFEIRGMRNSVNEITQSLKEIPYDKS